MKSLVELTLWSLMALLATGCATGLLGGHNYDVTVTNVGSRPILGSEVKSAKGFWHAPGYLSPGARKSIAGPFKQPCADIWTVTWMTAKGEKLEKTLNLTKAFEKPFQGQMVFSIDGDNNLRHVKMGPYER